MLSISIVVYESDLELLNSLFKSLIAAVSRIQKTTTIFLIDNGSEPDYYKGIIGKFKNDSLDIKYFCGHGNIGYGRGHNLILDKVKTNFHLIINPDVIVDKDCLKIGIENFHRYPDSVILCPKIKDHHGNQLYLGKTQPSVLNILSKFLPGKIWREKNNNYSYKKKLEQNIAFQLDIASGCFLLCKTQQLKEINGFDPEYFMYFEDYALCNEMRKNGVIMYIPEMEIVHFGGNVYKKGLKHILMYILSFIKYFNNYGWKFR